MATPDRTASDLRVKYHIPSLIPRPSHPMFVACSTNAGEGPRSSRAVTYMYQDGGGTRGGVHSQQIKTASQ